jgi:DNA-binding MarR family transcriptional regulator
MLSQAESGTLRPSELAEQIGLSRSATTRLIDRIESEGLVQRSQCPADGRGSLVGLTGEGEKVFRRAGRVHLRGIGEHVGRNLSLGELAELQTLLTKLAAGVEGNALSMIGSDADEPG